MDDMIDGSVVFPWQRINMRALVESCCGWNKKIWADAVQFGLNALPVYLDGKKVIEIGASEKSTLSPIFSIRGAQVICSYYSKTPGFKTKPQPSGIPTIEVDIKELVGRYDIIVMKSVLGGVFKNDDYAGMATLICKLLKDNLTPRGVILSIDNGYVAPFHKLRRHRGTGGNAWTYIEPNKFIEALTDLDVIIRGFGYLNVASAWLQLERFKFGRMFEFVNTIIYYLDKIIIRVFKPSERAVLTIIIRR